MADYDRGGGGYDAMPDASAPNVSFLLTLLTMLDFTRPGQVGKEDWERGIAALHAPGLSWEVSWQMLLRRFDLDNNGSIDFGEMHGLAPLDPRLAAVLRVMTQTIVHLSERINGAYAGINETKMKMLRGTINQWKEKSLATTFKAWKADVQKTNESRRRILANFRFAPCRKCLHAMHSMIATRKSQMQKAANMMVSGEMRLKQLTFTMWRDAHMANQEGKNKKLMMFFMGRDEWWRMHVLETWRNFTRHERGIRRFLMRWMFMGMAKTFTAWQRYVRQAVTERNLGLAKGMAMLSGGTRYKCFRAWANEAQAQRDERDATLRQALLRNGALMEVKVVRAWFDWRTTRLASKKRVVWKVSPAGCAFRAWLGLIDAKRRKEFLEWALGADMSLITGKLKAATKTLSEDLGAQIEGVREGVSGLQSRLKQEIAVERKAVREALETKVDISEVEAARGSIEETKEEIDVLREQLSSQAEVQRALSLGAERASVDMSQQLHNLSREVESRVTQAQQDLNARAGQEELKLNVVAEELTSLRSTKANHDELLQLVKKINHRPKPGLPVGVQQLLAVPYPMPPGATRSGSSARSQRSSLQQQQQQQQQQRPNTAPYPPAEMREVPTELPPGSHGTHSEHEGHNPLLATTEQILLRPLPADALADGQPHAPLAGDFGRYGGSSSGSRLPRSMVPPSSPTATLSARASPTVNAIIANRRPTSARDVSGGVAQLEIFNNRTERLERSLTSRGGSRRDGAAGDAVEPEMPPMV